MFTIPWWNGPETVFIVIPVRTLLQRNNSYKEFTENKDRKDDYQEETEKALEIWS